MHDDAHVEDAVHRVAVLARRLLVHGPRHLAVPGTTTMKQGRQTSSASHPYEVHVSSSHHQAGMGRGWCGAGLSLPLAQHELELGWPGEQLVEGRRQLVAVLEQALQAVHRHI